MRVTQANKLLRLRFDTGGPDDRQVVEAPVMRGVQQQRGQAEEMVRVEVADKNHLDVVWRNVSLAKLLHHRRPAVEQIAPVEQERAKGASPVAKGVSRAQEEDIERRIRSLQHGPYILARTRACAQRYVSHRPTLRRCSCRFFLACFDTSESSDDRSRDGTPGQKQSRRDITAAVADLRPAEGGALDLLGDPVLHAATEHQTHLGVQRRQRAAEERNRRDRQPAGVTQELVYQAPGRRRCRPHTGVQHDHRDVRDDARGQDQASNRHPVRDGADAREVTEAHPVRQDHRARELVVHPGQQNRRA